MRQIKRIAVRLDIILLSLLLVFGAYSLFTAPDTKADSQKRLEEELEQNARQLETQCPEESEAQNAGSVTMIGDSVLLGASPAILELFPDAVIDAKESRQVVQAESVINDLDAQGRLGDIVVIALGTNGAFRSSAGQALIDRIGENRTVYWVTVYGEHLDWQDTANAAIEKVASNNENVTVID